MSKPESKQQDNNDNSIETLMDGVEMTVSFTNQTEPEKVKVRKVPVRQMGELGSAWGKEPEEVAVYTDKSPEWVDRLDDESFEAVIEEGRRLNFLRFKKWFGRQQKALEAMGQGDRVDEAVSKALDEAQRARASA